MSRMFVTHGQARWVFWDQRLKQTLQSVMVGRAAPFAHDGPITEQAEHHLHDIEPVDVSGRIDAGQEGDLSLGSSATLSHRRP